MLVVLLTVEGILLLSQRFQWFAFNGQKGWTVLISLAAVGLFLLCMLLWFVASLIFRLRFQFSIRSLLVLTVAVAIPFSWLAVEMENAREQREAVAAIKSHGGDVLYECEMSGWEGCDIDPEELRYRAPTSPIKCLGIDFFHTPACVWCEGQKITDAIMIPICSLPTLKRLDLLETCVSDAAIDRIGQLSNLKSVTLEGSTIGDEGLRQFSSIKTLLLLDLRGTKVTNTAVAELQKKLPRCHISHGR
jgi:hypothetical protein